MKSEPLILTLKLDADTFARLDDLRRRHFPPDRNVVPAHLTLFHALPGEQEPDVRLTLEALCPATPPFEVNFPAVFAMPRGVAVKVECPPLVRLRKTLAAGWGEWLSPQDRQGLRPHVTVQNKADPAEARLLYEQLAAGWEAWRGRGEGLLLWRYLGGPWDLVEEYPFGA